MRKIEKPGKISHISPKQMVGTFSNNPPVHAKTIIEKHYIGLWIKTSGIIRSIDLMSDYITFNFYDVEGTYMSTNFFKPIDSEVSQLRVGDEISLVGKIFNVGDSIIVLDYCMLVREESPANQKGNEIIKPKWWENSLVQGIALVAAILGILGFLLIFKK